MFLRPFLSGWNNECHGFCFQVLRAGGRCPTGKARNASWSPPTGRRVQQCPRRDHRGSCVSPYCLQSFPTPSVGGPLGLHLTPIIVVRNPDPSANPTNSLNLTAVNSVMTTGILSSSNSPSSHRCVSLSQPHFNRSQNLRYRFWSSGILCVVVHARVLDCEMNTTAN